MRNLFLKIFLSILVAVLAAFGVGLGIASWARPFLFARAAAAVAPEAETGPEGQAGLRRWHGWPGDLLRVNAFVVEWLLAQEGPAAAAAYLDTSEQKSRAESYLLDQQGNDVRGRSVPQPLQELARQAAESGERELDESELAIALAVPVRGQDGAQFVYVATIPNPRPQFMRSRQRYRLWRNALTLTPVILTLGIVCLFVARYVSGPVLKLRLAVRRFADGDLEHRVRPVIGNRQDELGELARDFDQMAERLAALLSAHRRLMQDISHELRSPLARQTVALELARQEAGDAAQPTLDRVEREGERLGELVSELLTLTRLESDAQGVERTLIELDQLVREIAEDADFEARSANRSVRLDDCAPCAVFGVPGLMRRAVENVVRNAIVYTAEGTELVVSLGTDGSECVVRVKDHGPGVPEDELPKIFRAFYRVSRGRERQTGGTGLGLAITERAVRSHGGTVSARNAPEGGLIVEIRLPLAVVES
jgi:two-component system sensor histidine kinase CpxA